MIFSPPQITSGAASQAVARQRPRHVRGPEGKRQPQVRRVAEAQHVLGVEVHAALDEDRGEALDERDGQQPRPSRCGICESVRHGVSSGTAVLAISCSTTVA